VLRAIRAEKSVGSASASSSALVCSDWVWPCVAAIASMVVRITLFRRPARSATSPRSGMRAQRERARVLRIELRQRLAHQQPSRAHFCTSMKKFIPMAQKNEAARKTVDVEACGKPGAEIIDAVGQV